MSSAPPQAFRQSSLLLEVAEVFDTAQVAQVDGVLKLRLGLRAGWFSPRKHFRAGVTAEESTPKNGSPGFAYDAKIRQ